MDTSMGTPEDDNDPDGILEGQMAAWLADKAHRRRLLEDFPYFCEHALKLRAESGELIPLIFNRSQRRLWAAIEKQWKETGRIRVVICKASDLTCFTSRHDSTGRMVLESKDAIRRKLGRSPDEADAVALTFADGLHATGSHGNMPYHGKPLPYPDLGIY